MLHLQNVKHVFYAPRSIATNATASVTVDCQGYAEALVTVNAGLASSNLTVLKLAFGTASNSFSDVAAFNGGTATSTTYGFVIPSADTSDGVPVAFHVDLKKRERYMKIQVENTSVATIVGLQAILGRGTGPDTDAERGVDEYVIG